MAQAEFWVVVSTKDLYSGVRNQMYGRVGSCFRNRRSHDSGRPGTGLGGDSRCPRCWR